MQLKPLSALFIIACCLRLAYAALDIPVPPQDTRDYDELALNVLNGEGYVSHDNWHGFPMRSWRPPTYPLFLAAVYGTWGYSHAAVQVAQAVLGAATVLLLFLVVRRLHAAAAWPAALAATLYEPLVSVCSEIMSECLFIFLVLLALWALGDERRRWQMLVLGGAAVGLAAMARPVGLLVLPALFITALFQDGRAGWRRFLWASLATVTVIAPWTVRNYAVHGALVPLSTHGGFIVARSNALEPAWRQERGWGIDREVFEAMPTEVERDRFWWRQGREFIAAHPQIYARLVFERLLRFFYPFRPSYNLAFALVLPFAAVGMWRYGRRRSSLLYSSFIALSTLVFCTVLYGSTRFRLPLEPLFIAFAAIYLSEVWVHWSRRRWLGVVGGVLLVNVSIWLAQDDLRHAALHGLNSLGLR